MNSNYSNYIILNLVLENTYLQLKLSRCSIGISKMETGFNCEEILRSEGGFAAIDANSMKKHHNSPLIHSVIDTMGALSSKVLIYTFYILHSLYSLLVSGT